ncbi:MAG: diadenylate cyclase [Candidatus Hadarchaeota archaeon]|nr:diadenylate cyclase [Candidatus Hadarchaeota archaeon]
MKVQEALVSAAMRLTTELDADAVLALTETGKTFELIRGRSAKSIIERATGRKKRRRKLVAATPNEETYLKLMEYPKAKVIKLALRSPSRIGQIQHAVWRGLREGIFWPGELLICLVGDVASPGATDTLTVYRISETESTLAEMVESDPVLTVVVDVAAELGGGGYHGAPVGTAFVIGDSKRVLGRSRQLGINPFKGHPSVNVTDEKKRDIIKPYAFLDGAFVLDAEGNLLAAGRYLEADVEVDIPSGLGTRHMAVAAMTSETKAKGVTVSGTDGTIRIFEGGKLLVKIDPRSKILTEVLME